MMTKFIPLAVSLVALALPAQAQTSAADARALVQRYYAAIDRGDYRSAWLAWGADGRGQGTRSYAQFVRGFAQTRRTSVIAGTPFDQEGGAGSIYITVPVDVRATLKNGRRQRFVGTYALRRVNGVDGAAPWQLRWHLSGASLKPAPLR